MGIRRVDGQRSQATRPSGREHSVRKGDTLSKIARQNGISLGQLLAANPQIQDPDRIQLGQRIQLPEPAAPAKTPAPTPRPQNSSGIDSTPRGEQRQAVGQDPGTVQPELNTTGSTRQNGTLGLLTQKKTLDAVPPGKAVAPDVAGPDRGGPTRFNPFSDLGKGLAQAVAKVGPQKLTGVDSLQLLGGVKDGQVSVEIPLEPGKHKVGGVSFKVEANTVMRVQMEVRDGKLVPARDARGRETGGGCKVEIDPPVDLPVWITGRGAYLKDRGQAQAQFKADLGGWFDKNLGERGSFDLQDVVGSFASGKAAQAPRAGDASHPGSGSSAAPKASPLPAGLVDFDNMKFKGADVTMKDGVIDAGSARIDLAAGSKLSIHGSGRDAELRGQVRLDAMVIQQDGTSLQTGPGSARVRARMQSNADGSMSLRTRIDKIDVQIQGFESRDDQGNRMLLGPPRLKNSSIELETRLTKARDGSTTQAGGKTRAHFEAAGQLQGVQLAVQDGRGDARLAIGKGRYQGTIDIAPGGTKVDLQLDDSLVEIRDLQSEKRGAALDLHHLRVQGKTHLRTDGASGDFSVDIEGRDIDLRLDDYRGQGASTKVDLARTELKGAGEVHVSRHGGVQIDGDLSLKGEFDDLQVRTAADKLALDFDQGSSIDAQVSHFSAGGGKGFELDAKGEVDLKLEGYETRMPGLEARGDATLKGRTDLHIGGGQVFFTNADATVSVAVDDAKVAPDGKGFSLDAGRGSQLDLKVSELKTSSRVEENSIQLGKGSRLDAVLDGGEIALGDQLVKLEKGSLARFEIDSLQHQGDGVPALQGKLTVDAKISADRAPTELLPATAGVKVETVEGSQVRTRITVDDVQLRQDGRFTLQGVGVGVDARVERITGATGLASTDGISSKRGDSFEPLVIEDLQLAAPGPAVSPTSTLSAKRVKEMSAASIAGAQLKGQDFNPVDVARRLQDGTIEIEIPVDGTLGEGWLKSADFDAGTTLTLTAEVEDGKIIPDKTQVRFSESGDGPLWVTARGVYLDDENTLRMDLGGMRDFAVPGMEKMPLDVDAFVSRLTGAPGGAPGSSAQGSTSSTAASSGAAASATTASSQVEALKFSQARIDIQNARFKPGPLRLPGGTLDVTDRTRLSLSGTSSDATLRGHAEFNSVEMANDGVAIKAGAGSGDVEVTYRRRGDQAEISTALSNINLDVDYAVHRRDNGDYIHLANGHAAGASMSTTTTLHLDGKGLPDRVDKIDVNMNLPNFKGTIEGARATVPDADGTAQIEFGRSAVDGEIRVDHNQINLRGNVAQLDAAVRDFATVGKKGSADIEYARLIGSGKVAFSQDRGLEIDADVDDVDLRLRDLKVETQGLDLDAGRTLVRGDGKVSLNSSGEIDLQGDLVLDATLDSAGFDGSSIGLDGEVEVAKGSRLAAEVSRFSLGKDGQFSVVGRGGVDLGVENFKGAIPGIRGEGTARIHGAGDFEIDSTKGVKLPDRMNVDVTLRDGAIESPDGAVALDLAEGSTLNLRLRSLDVEGKKALIELGPGSAVRGGLDGGTLMLPGLKAPLQLTSESKVDFHIDEMIIDEKTARRARGRMRLEAVVDASQIDLSGLAGKQGIALERIDDARARLVIDAGQVTLTEDGRFEVLDTGISLDARIGTLQGRYGKNQD